MSVGPMGQRLGERFRGPAPGEELVERRYRKVENTSNFQHKARFAPARIKTERIRIAERGQNRDIAVSLPLGRREPGARRLRSLRWVVRSNWKRMLPVVKRRTTARMW